MALLCTVYNVYIVLLLVLWLVRNDMHKPNKYKHAQAHLNSVRHMNNAKQITCVSAANTIKFFVFFRTVCSTRRYRLSGFKCYFFRQLLIALKHFGCALSFVRPSVCSCVHSWLWHCPRITWQIVTSPSHSMDISWKVTIKLFAMKTHQRMSKKITFLWLQYDSNNNSKSVGMVKLNKSIRTGKIDAIARCLWWITKCFVDTERKSIFQLFGLLFIFIEKQFSFILSQY